MKDSVNQAVLTEGHEVCLDIENEYGKATE